MLIGYSTASPITSGEETDHARKNLTVERKIAIVGIALLVIVIVGIAVSTYPQLSISPSSTSSPPAWHEVSNFSDTGAGSKRSDTFNIRASEFRVVWNESACSYVNVASGLACGFSFAVYSASGNSRLRTYVAPISGSSQNGVEYFNGPGNFYVFVLSFGPGWLVRIQDYY